MPRKHFVQFFSPGTLVSETTTEPIASWDIAAAVALAKDVLERHGAKPYGFQFLTRIVAEPVPDDEGGTLEVKSREVERSGTHYITGELLFAHEATSPDQRTLLANMKCNRWPICIENRNSYRFTGVFNENDRIVDWNGTILRRGNDGDLLEYRRQANEKWDAERKEQEV